MEESKREEIEAEDPAGTPDGDEPYPEISELVRDAITKELSSPESVEIPEEKRAESVADDAQVMTTPDAESGDLATDGASEDSAEATDTGIDGSDSELGELRDILLGDDGSDGVPVSQLPRLITSVRKELRGAFEQQTEVLRTHSRDTRAILEELLSHVRAIAQTLNALETDPTE